MTASGKDRSGAAGDGAARGPRYSLTIEEQAAQRGCDDVRFRTGIELVLDGIRLRAEYDVPVTDLRPG